MKMKNKTRIVAGVLLGMMALSACATVIYALVYSN